MRVLGDLWSERIAPALETTLVVTLASLGVYRYGRSFFNASRGIHRYGRSVVGRVRALRSVVCGSGSDHEALFTAMSDPAVVLGPGGDLVDANPAAAEILTADEATLEAACPPLSRALAREASRVSVSVGGSDRLYDIERSSVSGGQWGTGTELIVLRDVTAEAGTQRELERETERLESLVSGVAHDLRNPLGLARVQLGLAREEDDDTHLAETAWALDRIDELVDDLEAGAREGGQATDMAAVDIEDTAAAAWRTVGSPEATLVIATDRTIRADRQRIQRLFENLFRNAVEHCESDVTVTVGSLPNGLYVEDDGPGIPGEMQGDVFDAGYSTKSDGSGFGLHIADRIVKAHDWHMHLAESDDGGARFEIRGIDAQAGVQTHSPA